MGQVNSDNISVSSQFLFQVFRSCQELGARKPVLLSALDIADSQLRDPQSWFGSDSISILCQATAQELQRENVTLDIGMGMAPTGFSDIGYAAMFGETVGDVMQAAATAMDFGADQPILRWEQSASTCRLIWDTRVDAPNELTGLIFSTLFQIGRTVTNGGLQPIKAICSSNRQPRKCDGFLTIENDKPGVPCYYNQMETFLELRRDIVDLANPFGNRTVERAGQDQLNRFQIDRTEPVSLARLSYNYLFHLLDKSGLSLDAAAETFGMAERTLRRKLVAEGASFRQILEQVRRDVCRLYFLEGTRSLSEIATKLGYSELSAFTRAYTAWHGRSPSRDMAAQIAFAA